MADESYSHDDGSNNDWFGGVGGIQTMGILNALKTGDVRVDMIVAMCIPIVFKLIFNGTAYLHQFRIVQRWIIWFFHSRHEHERIITYRSTRDMWGGSNNWDSDTQNTILIKAIQLYIHHKLDLNIPTALVDLTSTEDKAASLDYSSGVGDYDDDGSSRSYKTLVDSLSKYKIVKRLPQSKWHNLGYFGGGVKSIDGPRLDASAAPVKLRISQETEQIGNDRTSRQYCSLSFHFASPGATAIDAFIDTAYQWYVTQLRAMEDNSRYYYEPSSMPSASSSSSGRNTDEFDGDSKSSASILYKRYKLSEHKTFDSLFFSEKGALLNLVKHFTNKTGKYAIPGYPHKLGLLLNGPPGTGKTSLIKALAQATGRSIVNIPLAKISTNSELMSIFFDKKYHIQGEDIPVTLDFKDVIFVMEDVDSASRIVRGRGGSTKDKSDLLPTELVDLRSSKSIWRMLLESSDDDSCELVNVLIEKSDRLREEATKPQLLRSMAQRMKALPGLGLVGGAHGLECDHEKMNPLEETAKALKMAGDEALEAATAMLDGYSTVDRFVGTHAKAIKRLLDAGAEVDDEFVDSLLGPFVNSNGEVLLQTGSPPKSIVARDVSYSQQPANDFSRKGTTTESMLASMALMIDPQQRSGVNTTGGSILNGVDMMGPVMPWSKPDKDQLNLSGLLNVLDGVVDTPGRILIMTTNHPELLDPAIIRPGRIDKRITLGYIKAVDVISMLEHYFQVTLTDSQRHRVEIAFNSDRQQDPPKVRMTPAQVEQLTAEHDDIEEMIQILESQKTGT